MRRLFEEEKPIVETKYGKVRGITWGGVNTFLGIRYAKVKRYCEPEEPDHFEGVFDASTYGPQMLQMERYSPYAYERGLNNNLPQSEDCQVLNVWAAKGGKKMPVFVYIHGGGYFAGASIAENCFDGLNMAQTGNMVFVSMNHRLGLLGFLNLADYGEQFENAKNLGLSDLVMALKWIHENIEAFGGDPENVTIAGHSGGGGKVLSLYQIEEASKYFTRGICISGCMENGSAVTEEDSRILAKATLDELGITKENIEKIYTVSFDELVKAYYKAMPGLIEKGVNTGLSPLKNSYFRGFPRVEGFMPWSKDKPLMLASTFGEFTFKVRISDEEKAAMTEDDKVAKVRARFGEKADELLAVYRKAYPNRDTLDLMYLDAAFRRPTCVTAIQKAKDSDVKPYVYLFAPNMPTEGRVPAWHGADLAYAFSNSEMVPVCNAPVYGERLANAVGTAYINFCRYGNPNNQYMPAWKPFTEEEHNTMVIENYGDELRTAFDEELIDLYLEACPRLNFRPERKDLNKK